MATLHVRSVPDDLYALLRERAAANDRSIGAETIQLLSERLTVRGLPATIVRRRAARPTGTLTRFTTEARQAVVAAQAEARALAHDHVGTEHLLLGVLAQNVPVSAALRGIGVTPESVRAELVPGDAPPKGQLPFDPEAKRALELALRESTTLGDTAIAPRHVVLGIVGAKASRGGEILRAAEPNEAKLRRCLVGMQSAPVGATPAVIDASFRVVLLEGDAAEWESRLNEAAALGYELVEIVDGRAIFTR
jgi:plasmid stability protein